MIDLQGRERKGYWQQSATGKMCWPLDPRPDEIDIIDIAHSLSHICRFAGACHTFYSVADHSIRVSLICDPADAMWGLLHDASEYLLVDVPRPVKSALPEYSLIEKRLQGVICERFGLAPEMPASVARADEVLLMTEARDLLGPHPAPWGYAHVVPHPTVIQPRMPGAAKFDFLRRFEELGGRS